MLASCFQGRGHVLFYYVLLGRVFVLKIDEFTSGDEHGVTVVFSASRLGPIFQVLRDPNTHPPTYPSVPHPTSHSPKTFLQMRSKPSVFEIGWSIHSFMFGTAPLIDCREVFAAGPRDVWDRGGLRR